MSSKIHYAKKRIDLLKSELTQVVNCHIHDDGKLYLEFSNGMNFSLSEKEIQYQAEEFLCSELERIKNS